ncbi:DUF6318 family protein [Paenarthrobacter nitroguajacolicus]|uniref:DUF6318 family protein n=1 Tax=Paenarthrobacter nitroguajacolicus TaxID=211146 RepID=UPI00248B6DED|nr:DUF6318 family protein [Paenarthrobacter nitroguajacolicus]MDI2035576.1 hypothetical protein [Paenarthrobacter nitroguajacolicus]
MPRLAHAFLSSVRVRATVLLVGSAVLLSGCQGGSGPSATPSGTSTTTASPTSGESDTPVPATSGTPGVYKPADANGKAQNVPVPVMPELAKENSKAGLEAFIGYWFQELSYAYETGETSRARDLSRNTCILCTDLLSGVATNYSDGRWLIGGQYRTPKIEILWGPSNSVQSAKVQVLQQQILYMNADGSAGREPTAETNDAAAFFGVFANGTWSVSDLGVIR